MTIKKYPINEELAKAAKEANSMDSYIENSATNEYLNILSSFQSEAEKLIARHNPTALIDEQIDSIYYYADRYSLKLAEAFNQINSIRSSCPSILITGGSNFPTRKKEEQNQRSEAFWRNKGDLFEPTNNYYYNKIYTMLNNKNIYSNDDFAIEKLRDKLKDLEEAHKEMKAYNAYFRKNKTMKGYEGLSDKQAAEIDKSIEAGYSWNKQPYPAFHLANSNAEIKRIKERIEEITRLKKNAEKPLENKYPHVDGIEVIENAEAMRIQLIFDGKPDEATRDLLKHNGFHWSPTFGAWQRQLTQNGIYATKKLLTEINNKNK